MSSLAYRLLLLLGSSLLWGAGAMAASAPAASAAKAVPRPASPQSAAIQGPSAAEFTHWHRRYMEERGKAAKREA